MTEVSSVKAHADLQPAPALYGGPSPIPYTNGSSALDGTVEEEESSVIKCICGYSDDDGNTVLCEKCDSWQHIVCYYVTAQNVPDIHECVDCLPRTVDSKGAADKQRQRRELQNSIGERKVKPKTATKNHKKRAKDPLGSVQPNGWAVHSNNDLHYNPERKSGSPRDQPPPNKRPKTSHRTSGSVSGVLSQAPALAPGSRKRASSTMHNGHSPVKSPPLADGPLEEFSPEFMNLYRQAEPASADSNSYTDIGVANDISLWLNDREALAEATGGLHPGDVFQRIDQTIEDLEALAPIINKQKDDDSRIMVHGAHPQWQFLTVETFVPQQAFIGEVKGRIGRKEDYFSEPANRWDLLRHPEPFVFFTPRLPLYIDTRHEGTILRYVRRSCNPNIEMKILTQGPESGYHFCLIAMHDIEPDEELTIGWEIDTEIRQRLENAVSNGDIRKEGFKKIEPWVANVLSNFGGCACRRGPECLLQRARRPNNPNGDPLQPPKSTKGRKSKKTQVSPLSTGHATNSRAGSEAFNRDNGDDENADGRSTSGSHKSSSRDITPATHLSVDGGDSKMSDRERRKLQQQERLFEQLEYDEQHKSKRGKRNSAGSALNTPSLSSSVRRKQRAPNPETDQDQQKQLGPSEPSPSARTSRDSHSGNRKTSGSSVKTNGRTVSKPKPVYVDCSTQTDGDPAPTVADKAPTATKQRLIKRPVSFKHKLLQQATADREQRERSASVKMESRSPTLKDVSSCKASPVRPVADVGEPTVTDASTDVPAAPKESTPLAESNPPKEEPSAQEADVDMKDADTATTPAPPSPKIEEMPDAPILDAASDISHPPAQPPPPPWPKEASPSPAPSAQSAHATAEPPSEGDVKPEALEIRLPSPDPSNPAAPLSAITPGSALAQSPSGLPSAPSPFSPSVSNAVNPTPARKKLSLSDYTNRRAKLAQTQSTGTSATPPLAQSQSMTSPTLSTASLPTTGSPSRKSPEPVALSTVSEEPNPTPTTT
ncbi:hypothetical protein BU24DRAFT_386243 [Aaosphaeria arxii CBS 175.79]|uniref:SET domain-containing protein n=1 Tax=Aaosphaeria arxii CBS 175.79 TaxID=1450172 RepID=A0A6A5Y3C2_9PLEO|nr:uncharacterized protein BU24DRAFT_386243 [Aaosphaeria arxii CBS 175.79]KAF2019381.1 hypothetical protein BU24DRAFT_386243 [Aaosphaeria arxii CBS 175.79]